MVKVRFDHVYVSVKNMDRAIRFYEEILGIKVKHREGNIWADFDTGKGCYFGLIDPKIVDKKRIVGNNSIPVFWTDDVDNVYEIVKRFKVKIIYPPTNLDFTDYPYKCFGCEDTEGNILEIAKY